MRTQTHYDFTVQSTTSIDWYTPANIFEALGCQFDLDPASPGADIVPWIPATTHYTHDGLERPWEGFTWLNPPWGRCVLPEWLHRFQQHGNGIALVPERTSTKWWQQLARNADILLFVEQRISFINGATGISPGPIGIGSTLVGIGERAVQALVRCKLGIFALPYPVK